MPFPSNCAHKYATLVVFGMQSKKENIEIDFCKVMHWGSVMCLKRKS